MSVAVSRRPDRPGAVWAVPGLVFFALFALFPIAVVAYLSLTNWDAINTPRFIGLDNWSRLFEDPLMRKSLRISLLLTAYTWLFQTPVALLLGVWAAGHQRNRAVLSAIFFLPLLLSSAAIAVLFQTILDPNFGLAAKIGPLVGVDDGNFIGTSRGALLCVAFVAGWQFIPFHMLLYQAGTRQIPETLYQAAMVDGASRRQQFFHITLPQLRNTIVSSSVIMIVGSLTYFDTVLILTNGAPGDDTYILPFRMYVTAFRNYDMGYASALAFALVIVATAISLLLVKLSGFGSMRSSREGL